MTEKREYIINACNELEPILSKYGFKVMSKGLRYKRSLTKDISQEIKFIIQRYYLIRVSISVHSKKMKKWNIENNISEDDYLFFQYNIGYMTPLQKSKIWEVGQSDVAKKQFHKEILNLIEKYIIPFFNKFNDMDSLVNDLVANGGRWSEYSINELPIRITLVFGNLKQSQMLLNNYCKKNPKILSSVKRNGLDKVIEQNFNLQEFLGAMEFKIAFANGLKII